MPVPKPLKMMRLALRSRIRTSRACSRKNFRRAVDRGGELAVERLCNALEVLFVTTVRDDACGAEDLLAQRIAGFEGCHIGAEQSRGRLRRLFARGGSGAGHELQALHCGKPFDAAVERPGDAIVQHGRGRPGADQLRCPVLKRFHAFAPQPEHQPGIGAELANTHRQRGDERLGNLASAPEDTDYEHTSVYNCVDVISVFDIYSIMPLNPLHPGAGGCADGKGWKRDFLSVQQFALGWFPLRAWPAFGVDYP